MIKFGEWRPDDSPFDNQGLITATNVLPGDNEYLPIPSVVDSSGNTIDEEPIGAFSARDEEDAGVTYTWVGTASKLYTADTNFADVSVSGGYNGTELDRWEFTKFGNYVLATNFQDAIQVWNITSSSAFAVLGGSPPKARHIASINNFVVVGNTNDGGTFYPQRVRWSGIGAHTSWTVSATTQADYQDLNNTFGWVQSIHSCDFGGVIFQEKGIVRMTYVGSPIIFQFDVVNNANGALSRGGQINLGDVIAYIGQDGFYLFDGQTSVPVGTDKVNKFFFDDFDPSFVNQITTMRYPYTTICAWSYRSVNAPTLENDKIIFFNYAKDATSRWTIAEIKNSLIFNTLSKGYTLEELDNYGSGSQTLETLPYSLDSPAYMGNKNLFGVMRIGNSEPPYVYSFSTLDGDALDTEIVTGEFQLQPGGRVQINRIRPFVDSDSGSASVYMRIGARDTLSDNVSWSNNLSLTNSGYATARSSGRYHRIKLTTTGNFKGIQGFDITDFKNKGDR